MKKLTSIILIGILAASVTLPGCSFLRKSSSTPASSGSNVETTSAQDKNEETTVEKTTAAEDENREEVVLDSNGIKLIYTGFKDSSLPSLTFRLENSSDKSYMVSSEDVSINDCMISTAIIETVAPGKKSAVKMTMFKSDLKDNGIEKLEKVEFKLHCTNSDDFLDSFESDVITINNP